MKRILLTIALMTAALVATAQDIYSSVDISRNQYTGTARTMALGNAVTAVGGDLGAVNVNPAASAVYHYGQFVISPGFSRSTSTASFAPTYSASRGLSDSDFFGAQSQYANNFGLPNIGASMYIGTGRDAGLTGFSFSFVSNTSANYLNAAQAGGINDETSISGAFASMAFGIPEVDLQAADAVSNYNLNTVAAYRSYVISPLPYANDEYYGAAEVFDGSSIYTGGPLNQISSQQTYGVKKDMEFNVGFNFSDRWMLGVSLGVPHSSYEYIERFVESAHDYRDFPLDDTYLDYITYQYKLNRDVSGVYGKFGVIWLPTDNLRLGASFRTPTRYSISEEYDVYQSLDLKNKTYTEDSEFGEFEYRLRSPYTASFGIATTLASRALLSVDYELADYSIMKYSGRSREFEARNVENSLFGGLQHALRAGAELFVTPEFALRAGYTLTTSPLRYYDYGNGGIVSADNFSYSDFKTGRLALGTPHAFTDRTQSASFGFGYASPGSFFMDAAARCTFRPKYDFVPYADYIFDEYGDVSVPSPTVRVNGKLWEVVLTFGWRF
ncbi:MAG: hypothetical protein K6D54_05785 [Bacteroidales bacterium]|nr:hypothetical protein [Bacteroidales bacterium]